MNKIESEADPSLSAKALRVLSEIREEWLWLEPTKPGAIANRLAKLRTRIGRLVLPERRTERAYPRTVKRKWVSHPRAKRTTSPTKSRP